MKTIDAYAYEFSTHYVADENITFLSLRVRENNKTLIDKIVNHHIGKPSKKVIETMISEYVRIVINKGFPRTKIGGYK